MRAPHASHFTTTLVIAAALAAGMLAFLVSTPSPDNRVDADELGFASLDRSNVFGALGHAAEHHRAAHRSQVESRAATATARRWLDALPGSGVRASIVPANLRLAPGDGVAARRVAAFERWADDLPARGWHVTLRDPVPVEDVDRTWTIAAELQVDVAQAKARTRRQVVPLELELRASEAMLRGAPRRWVVQDATMGTGSGWLRAYRDPVVLGNRVIDVIAPSTARTLASDAAATATATLAPTTARYASVDGVANLAIWMVERPARVRAVTGRATPAVAKQHELAWADDRGDVIVDLSLIERASASEQAAAIRHAVVHVATRNVTKDAPAILTEGIALAEARRASAGIVLTRTELEALDEAFSTRTSGIADLLVARPAVQLVEAAQRTSAVATVAWMLDERGPRRVRALLASIDDGVEPATALRRSLGLAPRGVELEVAAWVRAQLPDAAKPDHEVADPDGMDQE